MKLNKIIFKESIFQIITKKNINLFLKNLINFSNFKSDIKNLKKTEYILNDNFKFNFNIKDLKKFENLELLPVGMGGSILELKQYIISFKK